MGRDRITQLLCDYHADIEHKNKVHTLYIFISQNHKHDKSIAKMRSVPQMMLIQELAPTYW
jgi:hypothetical protein